MAYYIRKHIFLVQAVSVYCINSSQLLAAIIVSCACVPVLGYGDLVHILDDPEVNVSGPSGYFGWSVAIEGNHALVGTRYDNTLGKEAGQVHLFDSKSGNILHVINNPDVAVGRDFGKSLAIDGNHILIGASEHAHLYDATSGNLLQSFYDPTPLTRSSFGQSVDVFGNYALIGAYFHSPTSRSSRYIGQAYLFDVISGNLLHTFDDPTATNDDFFGSSVAIDGNHVLIGAFGDDTKGKNVGQAYLFDAISGNHLHTFDDPTVTGNDNFGESVAIDGNYVLIGDPGDSTKGGGVGQAHLFEVSSSNHLYTFDDPTVTHADYFGNKVAIDGKHALIASIGDDTHGIGQGQAYLFNIETKEHLSTLDDPTISGGIGYQGDAFGSSVAIDGNQIIIGARTDSTQAYAAGQAYLFTIEVPEPDTSGLLLFVIAAVAIGSIEMQRS